MTKDFIVALFKQTTNSRVFIGTGFIVENKLYTVAKIFSDKKEQAKYSFLFGNKYIPLNNEIFSEYDKKTLETGFIKDLKIFQVDNIESPYRFSTEKTYPDRLLFCAYSLDGYTDGVTTDECYIHFGKESFAYPEKYPDVPVVPLKNALDIKMIVNEEITGYPFTYGNQGAPLIDDDNVVYGMYTGGHDEPEVEYALKADYILDR